MKGSNNYVIKLQPYSSPFSSRPKPIILIRDHKENCMELSIRGEV